MMVTEAAITALLEARFKATVSPKLKLVFAAEV